MRTAKVRILDEGRRSGAQRIASYTLDYNEDGLLTIFETEEQEGQQHIPSTNISFDRYQMVALYQFIQELLQEDGKGKGGHNRE